MEIFLSSDQPLYQPKYFVKLHSDSTHKYFEVDIKAMLTFLIENIFVDFGNQVFQ